MIAREEQGMTLLEVIVAVTILVLILGGAYSLLYASMKSWEVGEKQIDLQQNVRIAIDRIQSDLREATGIAAGSSNTDLYLVNREGAVIWYYLHSDGNIRRAKKEPGYLNFSGHNPIAYNIDSLFFVYDGQPVEESSLVKVTVTGRDPHGRTFTLETQAKLRAVD